MNYTESIEFIHSLDKFGSRPGLDRVKRLFDEVPGTLDQSFIHVAGTNGKGSVCMMLSSILRSAGYKTGLFISPYITDFRERMQINGQMISKDELAEEVTFLEPILERLNSEGVIITEFEFLTVLGFRIFKKNNCDVIVCEVGMGGLLDSTNLIAKPLCSVITRVDLDHTAILGNTIEEVAAQKAGIIKRCCPTAVASQITDAYKVIEGAARKLESSVYRAEDIDVTITDKTAEGTRFIYRDTEMLLPLLGSHQVDNLRCALAAVEALDKERDLKLSAEDIRTGLKNVKHPARFEKLGNHPVVILDGAHNPNGLAAFAQAVRAYFSDGNKVLIIGMLADKDSASLHLLSGLFDRVIATDVDNPRALPAENLAERLSEISDSIEVIGKPSDAFDRALMYGDGIFICGSLYLASEIRPYIISKLGKDR